MNIPVLSVSRDTIPEAWEASLVELYQFGGRSNTQYDKKNTPKSIDATMLITVNNPLKEPMIHRDFPASPKGLGDYVKEIIHGTKDAEAIKAGTYTYHQRLRKYDFFEFSNCDQIDVMIKSLASSGHSRRIQAITWNVPEDIGSKEPPCLQRIWCRIFDGELNMNVSFRSNDAYKAAFMNIFALVMLQKYIADQVSVISGNEVKVGRYCHIADSYHIYGDDIETFENRFLKCLRSRSFENRTWNYQEFKSKMEE